MLVSTKTAKLLAGTIVLAGLVVLVSIIYNNVVKKTSNIGNYQNIISGLSGRHKRSRTLILFSNNAEQRYGGGFIGSVGYIDAAPKTGVKIDPIHSVYYYDHLKLPGDKGLESAPMELGGLVQQVWLRDSGYSISWPDNAERAAGLFEYESGKKVDNVVMLTPNVIKAVLKVSGPVELPDYGFKVTDDNFLEKVQLEVEAGDDKSSGKDPKTILGVLANSLLDRIYTHASLQSSGQYAKLIEQMAASRQLAIYSRTKNLQENIKELGLSGSLEPADGNYLAVAEANVGANKSSPFMKQRISQRVIIADDGSARVDVTIYRRHAGEYSHKYVDPHDGQTKWLVGANLSYLKISLPAGSEIERTSFEQSRPAYNESGRLVVTFLSNLEPGGQAQYSISYKLPYKYVLGAKFSITSTFDKPIGSYNQDIDQSVVVPTNYHQVSGQIAKGNLNNGPLQSTIEYSR